MGDDNNEAKIREVERLSVVLERLEREVQDLAGRRFPWLPVMAIVCPVVVAFFGIGIQNMTQLNLTTERTARIQETIDKNQSVIQKQLDALAAETQNLRTRIVLLESKKN
jgi:hypothetical protein